MLGSIETRLIAYQAELEDVYNRAELKLDRARANPSRFHFFGNSVYSWQI